MKSIFLVAFLYFPASATVLRYTQQTSNPVGTGSGSGTNNTVSKFTGATTIGNSSIIDDGSRLSTTENLTITSTLTVVGAGNSPSATFSPNLSSSTSAGNLSGTFSATTLNSCISGSTITLNLPVNVSKVEVSVSGSISDGNLAANVTLGLMVDGNYVDSGSSSKGIVSVQQAVIGDLENFSFPYLITGLSSGQHNICLLGSVSAGTATIDSTNSNFVMKARMLP